ncbi:MAG TPA: hypothetical protein VGR02_03865, partial [Thermoanaerobaculia bacterium]|nr:hypothetical protein [Thermoanaerobaculia bacterium]
MNSHKKADLQRRLSATPDAKPPADLADRIKRDIPRHFTMNHQTERQQLSRSVSFNMRVAAGVLLVISAAYISMQLFSVRESVSMPNAAPRGRIVMAERVVADQKKEAAAIAPQPQAQAQVAQTRSTYDSFAPEGKPVPAAPRPMLYADARRERKEKDTDVAGGL